MSPPAGQKEKHSHPSPPPGQRKRHLIQGLCPYFFVCPPPKTSSYGSGTVRSIQYSYMHHMRKIMNYMQAKGKVKATDCLGIKTRLAPLLSAGEKIT